MTFLKIDSMKRDMNFKHAMILHIKNSGVLHAKLSSQLTKLKSNLVLFQYLILKKKVNFQILVMQKLQEIVMVLKPFTQLATKEMMLAYQLLQEQTTAPLSQNKMVFGNGFGETTLHASTQSTVPNTTELQIVLTLIILGNTEVLMSHKINGNSELSVILLMLWFWIQILAAQIPTTILS